MKEISYIGLSDSAEDIEHQAGPEVSGLTNTTAAIGMYIICQIRVNLLLIEESGFIITIYLFLVYS